tara:strand:+ start:2722 stop:6270 length:3549 start_codon:yes stop_codon:yes gene_type:complete
MAQVGRISGPLLTANLERNGIDLSFRDTLSTTSLLKLDVNNNRIGVNLNNPITDFNVDGTLRSTTALATSANIANFNLASNDIDITSGNINLNAASAIQLSNFRTDNIHITDNIIQTYRSNANIELDPNASGQIIFAGNTNVTGNVFTPERITADGNITFGDSNLDSVTVAGEIDSDLMPNVSDVYRLGAPTKRWHHLHSGLVNGQSTVVGSFSVDTVSDITKRTGNIFYVAQNGDDTNVGDHPNGPFKTLKHALDVVDASTQGPVTIHVMPGGYEEELPLVVPSNVTIKGEDFRNTIIRPTSADQSKDVFHLNGETTIMNITIKDFYYDSGNDTGYAFRFAPGAVISTRSPYIQNVTVITQGTTTSASDPRGFASGDAGKGALIDGAAVPSASNEASMLFHSATFITPGVDAITMTNGVRVEWLNSFTYFANRGLYAKNGVTGHLSTDGSTVQYGAEIRSIGSANVYGNKGAEADGNDCIMYLIAHNFAYIGAGKFVDNDPSRAIQANETIELNSGKIYHVSQDHGGDFRIGDQFFIDFDTGRTSLELTAAQFNNLASMRINDGSGETVITPDFIDIGNLRFRDNIVSSTGGGITLDSVGTNVTFNADLSLEKNISITGNMSVGRELVVFGNSPTDVINFAADINSDIIPDISGYYNIGSSTKKWKNLYADASNFADFRIETNYITTDISNADFELYANSSGKISIPDNNAVIDNNLGVNGQTTFNNSTTIIGNVSHNGNLSISQNYTVDNVNVIGNINVNSNAQFEDIAIEGNVITTTSTNSSLDIRAQGTGSVIFQEAVEVANKIVADKNVNVNNVNVTTDTTGMFRNEQIEFSNNVISTYVSNADLEITSQRNILLQESVVAKAMQLQDVTTSGAILNTADTQTLSITGNISLDSIDTGDLQIFDNNIKTTNSNSNIELRKQSGNFVQFFNTTLADSNIGTFSVNQTTELEPTENLIINGNSNLKVPVGTTDQGVQDTGYFRFNSTINKYEGYNNGTIVFSAISSDDRNTIIQASNTSNELLINVNGNRIGTVSSAGFLLPGIQIESINISDNVVKTNVSNADLELRPNGNGQVDFSDNIEINDNNISNVTADEVTVLAVSGSGHTKFVDSSGAIIVPNGTEAQRSSVPVVGMIRINNDDDEMEVYNGTAWQTAAGKFDNISVADMEDEALVQSLIYG